MFLTNSDTNTSSENEGTPDLTAQSSELNPSGGATEGDAAGHGGHKPTRSFLSKKKLIIIVVILLVLIGGGVGGFMFMKKRNEQSEATNDEQKLKEAKQEVFHDMDELLINLNTESKTVSFMKLTITLDIEGKENLDAVIKMMPRIRDVFQVYLRELRPTDMQGSVGLYRLREELLLRVNKLVYPATVKDILFKEVLVQ